MNLNYSEESSFLFCFVLVWLIWVSHKMSTWLHCVHYNCAVISSKIKMLIYLVSCVEFYQWLVLTFTRCPVFSFIGVEYWEWLPEFTLWLKLNIVSDFLLHNRVLQVYLCVVGSPNMAYTMVWCFCLWVSKRMSWKGSAVKWHWC